MRECIKPYLEWIWLIWSVLSIVSKVLSRLYKWVIKLNKHPRINKILNFVRQLLLFPANTVLFGLSYWYDLLFKNKYWIKIGTDYEYWDGTSYVWSLHSYDFVELAKCFNKFSNERECYKNAKSQLWVKTRILHKYIWWHDYYLVLLSKKQVSKFNRKVWDSPLYYIVANKSD